MNQQELEHVIIEILQSGKKISFLTGAGISAASGIPTFRGSEGYWKEGSKNYTPQEIGTYKMFQKNPDAVWNWFLFRKTVCRNAKPNPSHFALKRIENALGYSFALITQNVDGLHQKAGSSMEKTFQIHGDFDYVRCSNECSNELYPFPDGIIDKKRGDKISLLEKRILTCKKCGHLLRPHVLWFDESYNEKFFHLNTVIKIAENTKLLFVVGTTGVTTLPLLVIEIARKNQALIIDVNIEDTNIIHVLGNYEKFRTVRARSEVALPELAKIIEAKTNRRNY